MSDRQRPFRTPPAPAVRLATAILAGALLITGIAPAAVVTSQEGSGEAIVVYLMRHAETVPPPYEDDPPDPQLRQEGMDRAVALMHTLRDEPVTTVFSTDYNRTRQTAAVLAAALELETTLYDPRDLEGFVARLRATPGRHVVVGHSNTTPMVVEALGGEPGEPIADAWEFDRLYVVTLAADGTVTTVQLRYGARSEPTEE